MRQNRKAAIITGGQIELSFVENCLEIENFDFLIAADRGLMFFHNSKRKPTHLVGDFDSVDQSVLEAYLADKEIVIRRFVPEKDLTDTEIAIDLALELGADSIVLLGATGNRLDHTIGSIQCLAKPLRAGINCKIVDSKNLIYLLDESHSPASISKKEQYGTFVSLLPLTTTVVGLTLKGFKYPLNKHTLTSENSLGISNEIVDKTGEISFDSGILIVIESRD